MKTQAPPVGKKLSFLKRAQFRPAADILRPGHTAEEASLSETHLSAGARFIHQVARRRMRTHTKWNCDEFRLDIVTLVNVTVSLALSVITVLAPDCDMSPCSTDQVAKSRWLNHIESVEPKPLMPSWPPMPCWNDRASEPPLRVAALLPVKVIASLPPATVD